MTEIEKLRSIKEIDYDKYVDISSLEKLAVYGLKYLIDNNITTTWTNVVIATYYLFPRKFAISEDFLDFPNAERLNRTLLHLSPHNGRNYAIGSTKINYSLTPLGASVAKEVEKIIFQEAMITNREQEVIQKDKITPMSEYTKIKESNEFREFEESGIFSSDMIWTLYKVIPFTQKKKIEEKINYALLYANKSNDIKCLEFIKNIQNFIK